MNAEINEILNSIENPIEITYEIAHANTQLDDILKMIHDCPQHGKNDIISEMRKNSDYVSSNNTYRTLTSDTKKRLIKTLNNKLNELQK